MTSSIILLFLLCFTTSFVYAESSVGKSPSATYSKSASMMHHVGNRPIHLVPNHHNGQNKDWSCPPVSDPDGTGKCGLDLGIQETICEGEGGGSSTGTDGGHTCNHTD